MYHAPQRGDYVKLSGINSLVEAGCHYFVRLGTN
jgi:hypothetical protein